MTGVTEDSVRATRPSGAAADPTDLLDHAPVDDDPDSPARAAWRRRTAIEMAVSGVIGLFTSFVLSIEAWHLAKLLNGGDLDEYERVRRPLNIEYVQEQTIANKKRLEEREPAARQKRFDELKRMADDPLKHKGFLMRASLLETWKGKR